MAVYIVGVKRTEKGHQNLKEFSAVAERAAKIREANGGKLLSAYSTFGRFDFIVTVDYPNATAMQRSITRMLAEGLFTVEVSEAIPMDEFAEMLKEDETRK
jgi:uncharacterized protein with GYD domain